MSRLCMSNMTSYWWKWRIHVYERGRFRETRNTNHSNKHTHTLNIWLVRQYSIYLPLIVCFLRLRAAWMLKLLYETTERSNWVRERKTILRNLMLSFIRLPNHSLVKCLQIYRTISRKWSEQKIVHSGFSVHHSLNSV